jgi:formamidopyrimidine-DNA glycosylase
VPELPETETIARDLDHALAGARIVGVTVTRPDVLRDVTPDSLRTRTAGSRIGRCWRRAKLVVLDLSTGDRIVVQPRFTGALLVEEEPRPLPERERQYSTLAFGLDDGRRLHYRDIRRLGTVALMSGERWDAYSAALGVEPLDPAFSAAYLSALFRGSRQAVKKVVMDQRKVVGVGNIYANEALWRAGVDPARPANGIQPAESDRIHDAVVSVLRDAIAARGTSFRDYRDAAGEPGRFAASLAAYGRASLPCARCGATLAETHQIDGRTTVYCRTCQR